MNRSAVPPCIRASRGVSPIHLTAIRCRPLIVVQAPSARREATAGEIDYVRACAAALPGSVRQRTSEVRDPPLSMYSYTVMN
jgi:hypothetical protein